jgi:hypothetical protein
MTPPASFFGFFMAAVLNLPDRPISHKVILMLVFLCIVVIETLADARRGTLGRTYPLFKGGICLVSFVALSIVYTPHLFDNPLSLFGILVGGGLFGMTVYMPIRFRDGEKQNAGDDSLDPSVQKDSHE